MTTFALVHGACHGGWSWDPVRERLQAAGHQVVAPDLPCEDVDAGLEEYVEAMLAALDPALDRSADPEDLVVAAHSLGALTAPAVAVRRNARRLVFVAGIIGKPSASLADLAEEDADRDLPLHDGEFRSEADGRFCFTVAGSLRALYHDCPEAQARAAALRLRLQRSQWTEPAPYDAWPDCRIDSVVCAEDRIVDPQWSRRVTRDRFGTDAIGMDCGHTPMLARPAELTEILLGR